MFNSTEINEFRNMEDYKDISKLEELTIKYQKKAESSRNWVHHLQVVCYTRWIFLFV